MMGLVRGRTAWLLVLLIAIVSMKNASGVVLHKLGGNRYDGWKPDYNYTQWSMNEHFVVGDWLYFGYERALYNVLQVNQTAYENCIVDNPIKNVTGGAGRDVFQLVRPITYYFTSAGGWCSHSMKVAISVVNGPTSTIDRIH
ncbi:hypothetical protein ACHQM5_008973 [Ranunculus cassubicifolius]